MARLYKRGKHFVVAGVQINQVNQMYLDTEPQNYLEVDVKLLDKRKMSDQQRKFIFALCNDIAAFMGEDSEYIRLVLQQYNANIKEIEVESLSTCNMTYANGLIDTIITFCIEQNIPINKATLNEGEYHFTEKQTYMMCLKRTCAVCGRPYSDLHHVDALGMGNNRKKEVHEGRRMLPLCRQHHTEAHNIGNDKFIEKYYLTPAVCDKKMQYFILKGKLKVFDEDERGE